MLSVRSYAVFFSAVLLVALLISSRSAHSTEIVTVRFGAAAGVIDGKLYIVGGTVDGLTALETLQAFDPKSGFTPPLEPIPTPRFYPVAVVVGKKLYVIGGRWEKEGVLDSMDVYDAQTGHWESMPRDRMRVPRMGAAAAEINGKIYVVGGNTRTPALHRLDVYDPETDCWKNLLDMPTARTDLAAVAINGKLYAIGGHSGSTYYQTIEVYDPATNSWNTTHLENMPTARGYLAAVASGNEIFAIGGYRGCGLSTVEVYDTATGHWAPANPSRNMKIWRHSFVAGIVEGKLYVLSGEVYLKGKLNPVATNEWEFYDTSNNNGWISSANRLDDFLECQPTPTPTPTPKPTQTPIQKGATDPGGVTEIFENRTEETLYIYYAIWTPGGPTPNCDVLTYDGTLAPSQTKSYLVPKGQVGWFEFMENTRDAGCGSRYNKNETKAFGRPQRETVRVIIQ
jgi:N-acetylneuraminic acid mutarotase